MTRVNPEPIRRRRAARTADAALIGAALGTLASLPAAAGPPTSMAECLAHATNYCDSQHPNDPDAKYECRVNLSNHCYDVFGGGGGSGVGVLYGADFSTEQGKGIRRQQNRLQLKRQ